MIMQYRAEAGADAVVQVGACLVVEVEEQSETQTDSCTTDRFPASGLPCGECQRRSCSSTTRSLPFCKAP